MFLLSSDVTSKTLPVSSFSLRGEIDAAVHTFRRKE